MITRILAAVAALMLWGCETTAQTKLAATPGDGTPFQITVASEDNVLQGELHRLTETTPKTAVIIVGGSSARTRDDTAPAIPLFLDEETAVVVYDRRGNGASTGSFEIPDTENTAWQVPLFAEDVADIVMYLKLQGFERVGLLGSSMGGWVNVAAAARSDEIDFVICLSGGGSSVAVSDEFDHLTDEGMSITDAAAAARGFNGIPSYDPAEDLAQSGQPMLWIFGTEDDSNPTLLDVENLEALRQQGKPFRILLLESTNHDLINVETGEFNQDWIGPARQFVAGK